MKYIQLILIGFITLNGSIATAVDCCIDHHQHISTTRYNIESQLKSTRQSIAEQTHDNQKVLKQFDRFARTLEKTYVAGDGLIDKDILRIVDAIGFSAEKHRFQVRKDPNQTPYIIHPMGVANNLMVIGEVRDPDVIMGALLHDTVEDTDTTFEELEQRFGVRVANFVREVSDDKSLSTADRKRLQIEHAHDKSAGAAQIKLSDKLYNLTDLASEPPLDWTKDRIDNYFKWSQAVVDALPWVNAPLKKAVDDVIKGYWKKQGRVRTTALEA